MIHAGGTTVVVADSSKFGHRALAKVASQDEADLVVTDTGVPQPDAYGNHLIRVDTNR